MNSIKAVLLDISGTLIIGKTATPNAIQALQRLRDSGIRVRFVTNSSKVSDHHLYKRLRGLGFVLDQSEIFTSLNAAKQLIQHRNYRPLLLLEDEALEQFKEVDQQPPHTAVMVGLAPSKLDYAHMNQAFNAIVDDGAELVAIHKARYFASSSDGQLSMGPGGFVAALEYAADTKAQLVGKPMRAFYELALRDLGLLDSPQSVAMVGDDVLDDLGGGAQELGLARYLVRTGKYRKGDEDKADIKLNGVFDTFADVTEHLICPS